MKTATFIKQVPAHGDARLYRVNPPIPYMPFDGEELFSEYVVVSAINLKYGTVLDICETFIFPADLDGKILDWIELDGSIKGVKDHRRALEGAGYNVVIS